MEAKRIHAPLALKRVKQTLPMLIADELVQRIAARTYPEGRLPPAEHLAVELQVSRLSMLAALKVLEARGLVRVMGRRGTFVLGPDYPPPPSARAGSKRVSLADLDARLSRVEHQLAELLRRRE